MSLETKVKCKACNHPLNCTQAELIEHLKTNHPELFTLFPNPLFDVYWEERKQ